MSIDKYKQLFISEAEEKIADLNTAILGLEKKPNDIAFANDAMRAAHTIKSSSAAMGFMEMSHLSHAMENLFEQVRTQKKSLTSQEIEILFESADALIASIDAIKSNKKEINTSDIIAKLISDFRFKISDLNHKSKIINPKLYKSEILNLKSIDTIKVNIKTLGALMNLTEELLVCQMRFKEIIRKTEEDINKFDLREIKVVAENFNRLTNDLQYQVTQTHLVPMGQLFEQTPRIVRDLAKKQGKEIELSIVGQDIELDRTVMDRLGEPLIHLLRNAVDHGIGQKGKIILSAERLKDSVIITVINEGKPIDWQRVVEVAMQKNIISKEKRNELISDLRFKISDLNHKSKIINPKLYKSEILNLLYQLSTKKEVTETSGRGVGLGIVKSVIESLGGKVIIEPQENGTAFILKLPLTLAIIQALLIRILNQTFALPFSQVDRLVRVPFTDIKKAFDQEVAVVNEEDIPMIRLDQKFLLEKKHQGIFFSEAEAQETKNRLKAELVIITKKDLPAGRHGSASSMGIVVDEVFSEQNIVVKPLKGVLKQTKGFAGITLLGDGKPAMILDVETLI